MAELNAKINNAVNAETIEIVLSEDKFPMAFKKKLNELMDNGLSEDEARAYMRQPIVMELVYHENYGLFLVESDAIESTPIYSPYNGTESEVEED